MKKLLQKITLQQKHKNRRSRVKTTPKSKIIPSKRKAARINRLIWQGVLIGMVLLIIFTFIFSFQVVTRFRGTKFRDVSDTKVIKRWEKETNLDVLILGVDEKEGGLMFIDSMHALHLRPATKNIDIVSIDPNLSIKVIQDDIGLSADNVKVFEYRQLYNHYLSLSSLEESLNPLDAFVLSVENELGLKFDRYLILRKDKFAETFSTFDRIALGKTDLGVDKQLEYIAQSNTSTSLLKADDVKLQRQNELIKKYIGKTDNMLFTFRAGYEIAKGKDYAELVTTNLNAKEAWEVFMVLRDSEDYSLNSLYTGSADSFIEAGHLFLDKKAFDSKLKEFLKNQNILLEQSRIDVINGGGRAGAATKNKRLLANYSFNVVRVGNSETLYTHNTLYVSHPDEYPNTIELLRQIYSDLEIVRAEYPYRPTGDMVLVVI